jgi:hypothetical protein
VLTCFATAHTFRDRLATPGPRENSGEGFSHNRNTQGGTTSGAIFQGLGILEVRLLDLWALSSSEPKPSRPFYNNFSSEDEARLGTALAGKIEHDGIPFVSGQGQKAVSLALGGKEQGVANC